MASRTGAAFALVLALFAANAEAATPTAAERETARRLMDEGRARMKANELSRAIEAFQKAHEIVHVPTTGLALARAHLAAGHLVEARDVALEAGRAPREPNEPAVLEQARKQAKELEAGLKPRIPTVRVKAKGASRIAIDDVDIASTLIGEPIALNPGKHVVVARTAEGAEAHGGVELAERDAKELELTFGAAVAAPPEKTALAPVLPPARATSAAPTAEGSTASGERTSLAKGLLYGGFSVGAVGLGVGLVTGALTLSRASDLDAQCANDICAPSARGDLDSAGTLATVSTVAVIAAAVGITAGVVGLVLPRRPPLAASLRTIRFEF